MNESYHKLFGVSFEEMNKILAMALSKGGDYADLFFEHSTFNDLSLRDGEVNAVSSNIDYGVGIRVLKGDKTGYAYSEQTTMKEMLKAALTAAQISSGEFPTTNTPICASEVKYSNKYPVLNPWGELSLSKKKEYLLKLNSAVFEKDKRVIKVIERLSDSNTHIFFFNSLGEYYTDERPMASVSVTCIMQEGDKIENSYSTRSFMQGYEFLTNELIEKLSKEVTDDCSLLFEASQPKGGEMPVVMGAGCSGILLHEAIGHAFEADFNRKNQSIFSDKMGKRICKEGINVVDDGTLLHNRGAVNVDDEGILGTKTYMVKDGVLNSYLHDRISAKYYNTAPTGNGRRESFRFMPIPRMRATYMESGNCKEEELIHEIKKGIFVNNFSNGQVQIGAGDFTFFVKSGYMIENGHLTNPIKDINVIGNGPEVLSNIIAVADNLKIDDGRWICGKGQQVPVSCGMPSALIKKLTVGGTN